MAWKFNTDTPIYSQLVDKIKAKIFIGEYLPGEKLPSVRDFAREAGVNPNTMQKAMAELEACELVFTNRTSGRYITEDKELIDSLKETISKKIIDAFLISMRDMGFKNTEILRLVNNEIKGDDVNE